MLRRYIVRRLVAMPMRSPAALYNVSDLSFMFNMPPKSKTLIVYDVVICYKPSVQSVEQSYTDQVSGFAACAEGVVFFLSVCIEPV